MRARGFTLVEMLVVVVIIAGVTAGGTSMYVKSNRGDKAPSFSRSLLAMVHEARQSAATTGKYSRLTLKAGTASSEQGNAAGLFASPPVALGGTTNAPGTIELCTPASSVNPGTTPVCPIATTQYLCVAPSGATTLTSSATTCAPVAGTAPTGATLYVRTQDDSKHYELFVWGLTGLPKLVERSQGSW